MANAARFDVEHFRRGMRRILDGALEVDRAPRELRRGQLPRGLRVAA